MLLGRSECLQCNQVRVLNGKITSSDRIGPEREIYTPVPKCTPRQQIATGVVKSGQFRIDQHTDADVGSEEYPLHLIQAACLHIGRYRVQ